MPPYVPSPGVNPDNAQAVQKDQTAQLYRDQYLPLAVAGDFSEVVVDKLHASIQEFWLAGAHDTAQGLQDSLVQIANSFGAGPAAAIFAATIQQVLDSLNPPPPPPEQQAIISSSLLVQIGEKQALLQTKQAEATSLADEIQALTSQLADVMPPVGG